jgi:hypothetical protein
MEKYGIISIKNLTNNRTEDEKYDPSRTNKTTTENKTKP